MTPQGIPIAAVQAEAGTILKAGKFAHDKSASHGPKQGRQAGRLRLTDYLPSPILGAEGPHEADRSGLPSKLLGETRKARQRDAAEDVSRRCQEGEVVIVRRRKGSVRRQCGPRLPAAYLQHWRQQIQVDLSHRFPAAGCPYALGGHAR